MFATTDDLAVCRRPAPQRRSYSDSFKPRSATNTDKHKAAHTTKKPWSQAEHADSADEIQVMDDQQVAIPIRACIQTKHSDRHSDLDVGSVHLRKRRPSPLFERRKRDDLDLMDDLNESSDSDQDDRNRAHDHDRRGRRRHTKPLQHSRQTSPSLEQHRPAYGDAIRELYPPHLGHHIARGCSPHGRLPLTQLNDHVAKDIHGRPSQNKDGAAQTPPDLPYRLEHEPLVFDNFEDDGADQPLPKHEQEKLYPYDAHLHFVRPAMPICANFGATAGLEPFGTPASSPRGALHAIEGVGRIDAGYKRHRLGHYRATSEMLSATSSVNSFDARPWRRRATVGADAAYRLPTFGRR